MAKQTSVQKRVNEGVRVLTAVYGTRKVWGIGPKAIENASSIDDAIFDRLGIDYTTLTSDVDTAGLTKVKRTTGYRPEVDGSALGFYPTGEDVYSPTVQELKDAWIVKLREMRAESIGSTMRATVAELTKFDGDDTLVYAGC